MSRFPAAAAAAIALLAAIGANAASVTVSMDRSANGATLTQADPFDPEDPPTSYRGVIGEQGFEVGFQVTGAVTEEWALNTVFEAPLVSDCQGCVWGNNATVDWLTFTRPDGAPFSLRQISGAGTDTRGLAFAEFTPFDADGNPDFANAVEDVRPIFFDNLILAGVTESGQTVNFHASTFALQTYSQGFTEILFEPATLDFGSDAGLSDLVSLTLKVGGSDIASEHLRYWSLRGEIPDAFVPFLDMPCAAQNLPCVLDGVGVFNLFLDTNALGNWATAASLNSFSFDVGTAPAPVPLPATGVLALAAFGALGLLARQRRRL